MQEGYHSGYSRPRKMTKKQINEMIDNMKKSGVVSKKSEKYHKKEEIEAENILKELDKDS